MIGLIILCLLMLIPHGNNLQIGEANMHLDGNSTSIGILTILQRDANHPVRVVGVLRGLTKNSVHAFHVHTNGLPNGQYNCSQAGVHFNPYNIPHGAPTANISKRHVGDLGNVTANSNGTIIMDLTDSIIQLFNNTPQFIANRTLVLHEMRDDGGTGGFPDSNSTGNAGARIACGLIKLPARKELARRLRFSHHVAHFIDILGHELD